MSERLYKRTLRDGTTVVVHRAESDGVRRLTAVVRIGAEILKRLSAPEQVARGADALSDQARDLALDALRATGR